MLQCTMYIFCSKTNKVTVDWLSKKVFTYFIASLLSALNSDWNIWWKSNYLKVYSLYICSKNREDVARTCLVNTCIPKGNLKKDNSSAQKIWTIWRQGRSLVWTIRFSKWYGIFCEFLWDLEMHLNIAAKKRRISLEDSKHFCQLPENKRTLSNSPP